MPLIDVTFVLNAMIKGGFSVKHIHLGIQSEPKGVPLIVFDHIAYPGVEAHLFTIADASLWLPAFTSSGDVVLYRPNWLDESLDPLPTKRSRNEDWQGLLESFEKFSKLLSPYRASLNHGYIPRTIWSHHEAEWHHGLREAPDHDGKPIDEFLDYVDISIQPHICELNELGFITIESCSGLIDEHPDREPYKPYVMFDDRVYIGVSAHLFTLADIGQWIPSCAPHGFDVVAKQREGENIEQAWVCFIRAARALTPLIRQYQTLIKEIGSKFHQMRSRREVITDSVLEMLISMC